MNIDGDGKIKDRKNKQRILNMLQEETRLGHIMRSEVLLKLVTEGRLQGPREETNGFIE